jgi:hypothetical protein
VLACLFVSLVAPICQAEDAARPWQRWEHALTSWAHYANPYADVVLRVTYTGPGETVIRAYGFWDGGSTFRIRCAFPKPGAWRWQTECSNRDDAGLHRQSGTVRVLGPERTRNPLWRHGFLRVSDDGRYLPVDRRHRMGRAHAQH